MPYITHPKFNIKSENSSFQKGSSFPGAIFRWAMLNFRETSLPTINVQVLGSFREGNPYKNGWFVMPYTVRTTHQRAEIATPKEIRLYSTGLLTTIIPQIPQ